MNRNQNDAAACCFQHRATRSRCEELHALTSVCPRSRGFHSLSDSIDFNCFHNPLAEYEYFRSKMPWMTTGSALAHRTLVRNPRQAGGQLGRGHRVPTHGPVQSVRADDLAGQGAKYTIFKMHRAAATRLAVSAAAAAAARVQFFNSPRRN